MYSICIGSLFEIDDDNEKVKLITGKGIVTITNDEYDYRQSIDFFRENVSQGELRRLRSLKNDSLLAYSNSIEELYEIIESLHPVRRGVKLKSDGKQYIIVNSLLNEASESQSFIWQNSSGRKTLDELYTTMTKQGMLSKQNDLQNFIECVVGLVRADALYLLN